MTEKPPPLEIAHSPDFVPWIKSLGISIGATTYQTCRLFLIGVKPEGRLSVMERLYDRAMGLHATDQRLWMATRAQIWRFDNVLVPEEQYNGHDRLYVPRAGYTTGMIDAHDVGVDADGEPIFVSTLYCCLAKLSNTHSFRPIWKPKFISDIVPEDRCHLNGMAIQDGKPKFVTSCSRSDIHHGWRDRRHQGGVVIDVESQEVVASGFTMPHSPRVYRDKLWMLNSGAGDFGYVDQATGKFEPVAFLPGYLRGLAFHQNYAFVGLSKCRQERTFQGLALDERLKEKDSDPRCGIYVVNLDTGKTEHWIEFHGVVIELYDVQVIPGVVRPNMLGFKTDEINRIVSMENMESSGRAAITMLPPDEEGNKQQGGAGGAGDVKKKIPMPGAPHPRMPND